MTSVVDLKPRCDCPTASGRSARRAARQPVPPVTAGRLRGGKGLSKGVMQISQQLDRQFETAVLERLPNGWEAAPRVNRMAGIRLRRADGNNIGDIDVLAWNPESRHIWLLDAKRLAPGLAPDSMLRDAQKLEANAEHQHERLEWVLRHRGQLSARIGQDCADWHVASAIVIDKPLAGAHLARIDIPVWTYWELPSRLAERKTHLSRPVEN